MASLAPLALALALALVAAVAVPAGAASAALKAPSAERSEMPQLLDALRRQSTAPGVGFTFGDGHDDVTLSAGTRDVLNDHPIESTDEVRVGSDTKMFVAAVVLQLVSEGRVDLEAPVDRYLPGVLRYPASTVPGDPADYDGRTVTVRQLLQHTSGVPEYGDYAYIVNPVHQIVPPRPEDQVAYALLKGPTHAPGASWSYSNTDYILLGMLVQATTGRSIGAEIAERIVEPLGLANTFFAERGQKELPGSQVRGYLTELVPLDVTNFEPGVWGAAGALVSSADDMNTFISALLAGRVLPPAQLAEMQATVPFGTAGYGLGLVGVPLSCGMAWGHAGLVAGYQTFGLGLPNGRHAFLTMNTTFAVGPSPPANPLSVEDLTDFTRTLQSEPVSAFDLYELALCSDPPLASIETASAADPSAAAPAGTTLADAASPDATGTQLPATGGRPMTTIAGLLLLAALALRRTSTAKAG